MINRQKKFLREIIANYFGVYDYELCLIGDISDKTLKSDMQIIQSALKHHKLALSEENGKWFIPFEEKEKFISAYEDLMMEDETIGIGGETDERKMYVLSLLSRSDGFLSMNNLSDEMYVSKTTISSIVHELEVEIPRLVPQAKIIISGRKGIKLSAEESEIRNLLVRSFAKTDLQPIENRSFKNYLDKDLQEKILELSIVVDEFFNENNLIISNSSITKLVMHTMIIIQRRREGYKLSDYDKRQESVYEMFSKKLSGIDFYLSADELSSLPLPSIIRTEISNPISYKIVSEFIEHINKEYKNEILRMEDVEQFVAHIDEILMKGSLDSHYKEYVFDQMLQRLLNAFLLSGVLCKIIYKYTESKISTEERIYLAMHIQALYRKHIVIHENILLYNSNISECNMMKIDLEKHFGTKATIDTVYVRWDIEKRLTEKEYSVILGTNSILGSFDNKPFLKVSPFINDGDYERINKIVYKNKPIDTIKCIYQEEKSEMIVGKSNVKIEREIVQILDVFVTTSLSESIESCILEAKYKGSRIFVMNYNINNPFIYYHRMVNRFGQMIKNKSI